MKYKMTLKEMEEKCEKIIAAAKKSGVIIDTHNSRETPMNMEKEGIVIAKYYQYSVTKTGKIRRKSVHAVPLWKNALCCINPLGLGKDGKVYLSTWSIGGNVVCADIETFNVEHSAEYLTETGHPVLSCWLGKLELVA